MNAIWPSLAITLAIQLLASVVLYAPPVLAPVAQADVTEKRRNPMKYNRLKGGR